MMKKIVGLVCIIMLGACNNPCQQICLEIRDLAEECGTPFTNEDISECLSNQGKKNGEERRACAEAKPVLDDEWTCDNLEVYFD